MHSGKYNKYSTACQSRYRAACVTLFCRKKGKEFSFTAIAASVTAQYTLYGSLLVTTEQPVFTLSKCQVDIPADASDKIIIECQLDGSMSRAWFDDLSLKPTGE